MVNREGRRFADEGAGFAEQTFVAVAHEIARQPEGAAYQVFDAKGAAVLEDRYGSSDAVRADSIGELAVALDLDAGALTATVDSFNTSAHDAEYHPRQLDGLSTSGIEPPKSNWALRMDAPPFVAYQVTAGITYTYGGLKIDPQARVLNGDDVPIPGLFAAGEIVGGIFYHNSLRAAGLMHGSVFGRLAGTGAARE
jgi:tricarballylate dehydrogenase